MSSKPLILSAIRRLALPATDLPDTNQVGIVYEDAAEQFIAMAPAVGATALRVRDVAELKRELSQLEIYRQAQRIFSALTEVAAGNVDLATIADPKELNGLDLAILSGDFGVAENAAIWLQCDHLAHRAVHVAAEHLVLVVPADHIVHNMHQAYQRLTFDGPSYRLFISGPSKTADIEQSLVIGAQGPRSLAIFVVG